MALLQIIVEEKCLWALTCKDLMRVLISIHRTTFQEQIMIHF